MLVSVGFFLIHHGSFFCPPIEGNSNGKRFLGKEIPYIFQKLASKCSQKPDCLRAVFCILGYGISMPSTGFQLVFSNRPFKCSSYFEAFALCSTTETQRWCPSLRCIATSRSWVRCHHPTWTHSPALCSRTWTWWGALYAMMCGNFVGGNSESIKKIWSKNPTISGDVSDRTLKIRRQPLESPQTEALQVVRFLLSARANPRIVAASGEEPKRSNLILFLMTTRMACLVRKSRVIFTVYSRTSLSIYRCHC